MFLKLVKIGSFSIILPICISDDNQDSNEVQQQKSTKRLFNDKPHSWLRKSSWIDHALNRLFHPYKFMNCLLSITKSGVVIRRTCGFMPMADLEQHKKW